MARRKTKKNLKKNSWKRFDEHLVIAVMIVAGISILILLASYIAATGQAVQTGLPSNEGILNILNDNFEQSTGDGRMKCTYACGKLGSEAFISSLDGEFAENDDINTGESICSCLGNYF